jgi:hypothetical protein
MRESDKERTKLSATFLNNLGLAIIVAGFVAPLAAYGFRSSSSPPGDRATVLLSLIWLSVGVVLHFLARFLLRRLDQ